MHFKKTVIRKKQKSVQDLLLAAENDPSISNVNFVAQRLRNLNVGDSKYSKLRIAVLASFTIEPIVPFLEVECFKSGIIPQIYIGGYNQFQQEILNRKSGLYDFNPEVIVIAVRAQELCPKLLDSFLGLSGVQINKEVEGALSILGSLVETLTKSTNVKIIIHNFEIPAFPVLGAIDYRQSPGQIEVFQRLNQGLMDILKGYKDIYLLDYDRLTSLFGKLNWQDQRLWMYAKMPIAAKNLGRMAIEYMRFIKPIKGLNRKCLVLDLDNTLWGGILGEDGRDGIKLGQDFPGNIYLDFQKEILRLHSKGIILAINSKNDVKEVLKILNEHPDMILREEHFSILMVNWQDKDLNMIKIAKELNIGLDSLVFFDDNPVERELIKRNLPEVLVVNVPPDPVFYSSVLRLLPDFETLLFSPEDKNRGEFYKSQITRKQLLKKSRSLTDFYRSLSMSVSIAPVDTFTAPRLAQMMQRTNQFNLTAIKYSEREILDLSKSKTSRVYHLSLRDRFGDNGIIALAVIRIKEQEWQIDNFLMSCRVINRTVEDAFLALLLEKAKKEKIRRLVGNYVPTKKNIIVKDFYKKHGFEYLGSKNGKTIWRLEINKSRIKCPEWISRGTDQ